MGLSTDRGVRGQVDYRDLNFLDRAWRLGGNIKLDAASQSLGGELQFPQTSQGQQDSLSALYDRTDIQSEVSEKLVLGAKRVHTAGTDESAYGVRYFLEQKTINGTPSAQANALVPSYTWTRRVVDHLLYPTKGYVLTLQADAAAKAVLSDQDFLRGNARVVVFAPLSDTDQLIVRGEVGTVVADGRDGIPSDFLFRTGGDQTVRGYAYQSLGVQQNGATVGGRHLGVVSVEYVHWLSARWGAAAFYDKGDAADSFSALQPAAGYGAGVRWKSPVGPLNVDIAYGERTRQVRLHLALGFTF